MKGSAEWKIHDDILRIALRSPEQGIGINDVLREYPELNVDQIILLFNRMKKSNDDIAIVGITKDGEFLISTGLTESFLA